MFLNKIQLAKMENDIVAFFNTSKKIEKEIFEIYIPILEEKGCYVHIPEIAAMFSYSTVMQVNFGLSLELTLKRICYMTGHRHQIKKHKLVQIYEIIDSNIKNELEEYFKIWNTDKTLKSFHIKGNSINDTSETDKKTFIDILNFIDSHDLYKQRYAFENFSIEDCYEIICPSLFENFFNTMNNEKWCVKS